MIMLGLHDALVRRLLTWSRIQDLWKFKVNECSHVPVLWNPWTQLQGQKRLRYTSCLIQVPSHLSYSFWQHLGIAWKPIVFLSCWLAVALCGSCHFRLQIVYDDAKEPNRKYRSLSHSISWMCMADWPTRDYIIQVISQWTISLLYHEKPRHDRAREDGYPVRHDTSLQN